MFERFTDRARQTVIRAQAESASLGHNYIGTEHILLGLLSEESGGVAQKALSACGISPDGVRAQIEEVVGGGERVPNAHIPFTPRAKRILELALKEALLFGHSYIAPDHILLGLLREGEGVGAKVIQNEGIELNQVRHQLLELLVGAGVRVPKEARISVRPKTEILADIKTHAAAIMQLTLELEQSPGD